ncbi:MAG: TIGR03936 family radical SAM-associated protein [Clostridiales bacterium]|nr:TIGR03936 family radical SAM-associated protein [Clostridiales bacterium]
MKLVFEFTKTGNMIYISHLDLARLFLRVLRMSGLRPAYSQGFNPHPKMSFALPLAVGVHSTCELLEFEVDGGGCHSYAYIDEAVGIINGRLPEGVRVTTWREKPDGVTKSLASYAAAASYEIMCEGITDAPTKLAAFFAKESVMAKKRDKKTGGYAEKEIRPQMLAYRIIKDMRGRMLAEATLSAASEATLRPAAFFTAFCEASGLDSKELSPVITRTAILDAGSTPIIEVVK